LSERQRRAETHRVSEKKRVVTESERDRVGEKKRSRECAERESAERQRVQESTRGERLSERGTRRLLYTCFCCSATSHLRKRRL